MKRLLLTALLLFPALAAAQHAPDYRTGITPFMQKTMDRQLYTLRTDAVVAKRKKWKKAWIASWAAFAVANVLDMGTSQGKYEANPLLRRSDGTFASGRAAGIKIGTGAALLGTQLWLIHKKPEKNLYKGFTFANSAAAGGLAAVAASNSTK